MAPVLTGRSALKFLYLQGGETSLATLASTFDVDPAAIERLVRSLLAARLVCRTTDHLALSEAGKSWCLVEFKPSDDTMTQPAAVAPPAAGEGWLRSESRVSSEKPTMQRKANRMHGVQVVHVTRRSEPSPSAAAAAPVPVKNSPTVRQDPAPEPRPQLELEPQPELELEPAKVAVDEPAEKAAAPAALPSGSSPAASAPPRVVVDRDGFVTQIKGRRIY